MPRKWHIDGENEDGLKKIGYENGTGTYTFVDPHTGEMFHGDRDDGGNLTRVGSTTSSRARTPPPPETYETALERNLQAAANAGATRYECPIKRQVWVSFIHEEIDGPTTYWRLDSPVQFPAPAPPHNRPLPSLPLDTNFSASRDTPHRPGPRRNATVGSYLPPQGTPSSTSWSRGTPQASPRTPVSGVSPTSRGVAFRPSPRRNQSTPSRLPLPTAQASPRTSGPRTPGSGQFSTSRETTRKPVPSRTPSRDSTDSLPRDSLELLPQRTLSQSEGITPPARPAPRAQIQVEGRIQPTPPAPRPQIQAGRTPGVRPRAQPAPTPRSAPIPRPAPTPHPAPTPRSAPSPRYTATPLPAPTPRRPIPPQVFTNIQQTVNMQGYGQPINTNPTPPPASYYPGTYYSPGGVQGQGGQGYSPAPAGPSQHAAYIPAGPSYSSRPLPQPPRAAPRPATPSPARPPMRKRSLLKLVVETLFTKRGPPRS